MKTITLSDSDVINFYTAREELKAQTRGHYRLCERGIEARRWLETVERIIYQVEHQNREACA